ncbi:Zinc finger protein 91-like protein [Heterocephalus glaber]|uniref:E3 ubiquitin-protein ligase ZFP91 n=1 Tax=Heterocephalus glaber TaxID=10181 RepID=G5C907_HETGA|nr:Zinc finger protein 91-like protein [Heterocephalus glaber]
MKLICKSEPITDQLDYEVAEEHQSPSGIRSDEEEEEEEMLINEEEIPFKDDPRDETYKPHLERETPKPRRKLGKVKEEKEKKEIKVRKKPPIQYVRCEMEGCGTVLAHPRYLQHHIKYQHLLKKKYVCPHPSCGRLFRLQKQLLRHAKRPTDERDYICEYCAWAFKSSHNLAVHRMIHTGEKPLHFLAISVAKKIEKKDSVVVHKAKSHPKVLIAEALAANAGALITSTDIFGTNPESLTQPADAQGLPLLSEPLGNSASGECLLLEAEGMSKSYCSGTERKGRPRRKLGKVKEEKEKKEIKVCEICGFTCRQKASLNWHVKKHDADSFYQFSCNVCGKKFAKKDNVVAHKAKSHPEVLIAEALAANAGALITSTDILGTNPESLTQPADSQGLPLLSEPLGNSASGECLLLEAEGMSKSYCSGTERVSLMADGKLFVGSSSSGGAEGLVMNSDILGATTEVLIEDSDSTGP